MCTYFRVFLYFISREEKRGIQREKIVSLMPSSFIPFWWIVRYGSVLIVFFFCFVFPFHSIIYTIIQSHELSFMIWTPCMNGWMVIASRHVWYAAFVYSWCVFLGHQFDTSLVEYFANSLKNWANLQSFSCLFVYAPYLYVFDGHKKIFYLHMILLLLFLLSGA